MLDAGTATVRIPAGRHELTGDLLAPAGAPGVVVLAHGSGSSRRSSRNRMVASVLQQHGLATLLADLLTPDEELMDRVTAELRFDIPLLGRRVGQLVDWVRSSPDLAALPVGVFGASTGAAAALLAAADRPSDVAAVVSRGGRPDLAGAALGRVRAPTLLIVGSADVDVLELNRQALARLHTTASLEIVPGATHLFEEPGALERVAELAARWFHAHLFRAATIAGRS